jgi:hypothetical protein
MKCVQRVGAPVPGGRPNAEPGTGAPAAPLRGVALDLSTAQFGNAEPEGSPRSPMSWRK